MWTWGWPTAGMSLGFIKQEVMDHCWFCCMEGDTLPCPGPSSLWVSVQSQLVHWMTNWSIDRWWLHPQYQQRILVFLCFADSHRQQSGLQGTCDGPQGSRWGNIKQKKVLVMSWVNFSPKTTWREIQMQSIPNWIILRVQQHSCYLTIFCYS